MPTGRTALVHWLGRASIVGAIALAGLLSTSRAHADDITHVVAKGQTLGRIAKRYHTTVEALRDANDLRPGERLRPGRVLVIPGKEKERDKADRDGRQAGPDRSAKAKGKGADKGNGADGEGAGKPALDGKSKGRQAARGDAGRERAGRRGAGNASDDELREGKHDARDRWAKRPKRAGYVRMTRGTDHYEGQLLGRRGKLVPAALDGVSRMMRFAPTGSAIAIDPRLATLIGMVSDHFGGRTVHVVSGYRPYTPTQYTPHSNHNVGRAIDFSVDGVPNAAVRDFCKGFRNAGVGYYPNSSFVHLDVRAMKTFWIDYSGPGEAPRYDSPTQESGADEAVRDVPTGSNDTHNHDSQDADPTGGIGHTPDAGGVEHGSPGPSSPTLDRP